MKYSFLATLLLMLLANACKKADNNFNARISFLNGGIGAEPITIKLNDNIVISKDSFGVLKKLTTVPSGTFKVGFFSGANTLASFAINTNLESGRDYTLFLYDSVSMGKIFLQKDVLPEKVTEGKCAIRFFSLIPNTVNLLLQNDTAKRFITGKSFGTYSNAFEEADTTSRQIQIKEFGAVAAIDSFIKPLVAGKIYTIFLTGSIGGTGTQKPKMFFWDHN